jgi:N-acetylglucosamine kinase-like BadF-type ATPase
MILIADSGSTKTSWCFIDNNGNTSLFSTNGINPFFRSSENIETELREKLVELVEKDIQKIIFYGAGVINEEKGNIVRLALKNIFPAPEIEVHSDLLAAAHATLGNSKGIASILGTGSNSCFYDGKKITKHVPPLGFILGDEGSGAVLGRKLLADYLKKIMPASLLKKFENQFHYNYPEFMEGVYKKEKPNLFLANFVPFIKENIEESYCMELIKTSFNEFVERNIFSYSNFREVPLAFVGSVAFYFQEQLKSVLDEKHLRLGTVLKEPLSGLVNYYQERKR